MVPAQLSLAVCVFVGRFDPNRYHEIVPWAGSAGRIQDRLPAGGKVPQQAQEADGAADEPDDESRQSTLTGARYAVPPDDRFLRDLLRRLDAAAGVNERGRRITESEVASHVGSLFF